MADWKAPQWAALGREWLVAQGPDGATVEIYLYSRPLDVTVRPPRSGQAVTMPAATLARMVSMAADELMTVLGEKFEEAATLLPVRADELQAELAEERAARLSLLAVMSWNPTQVLAERNRAQRENEALRKALTEARDYLRNVRNSALGFNQNDVEYADELAALACLALGEVSETTTAEGEAGSETARTDGIASPEPPTTGSEFP